MRYAATCVFLSPGRTELFPSGIFRLGSFRAIYLAVAELWGEKGSFEETFICCQRDARIQSE